MPILQAFQPWRRLSPNVANVLVQNFGIGEVLKMHPENVNVLMAAGMHCLGCPASQMETIISDETNTYLYKYSGTSNSYNIMITYPDGSTYSWTVQKNDFGTNGYGGGSNDYDD